MMEFEISSVLILTSHTVFIHLVVILLLSRCCHLLAQPYDFHTYTVINIIYIFIFNLLDMNKYLIVLHLLDLT